MDFVEKYKKLKPTYDNYTVRLKLLIESLLIAENINYHLIEGRAKDVESFREKIRRKTSKYSNPLKEITDLCGLRIIVYYQKDIEIIDRIIKSNFKVDAENSVDKSKILNSNEFGYLSNHYVVELNDDRCNLTEWKPYESMWAEIQLRTVLQHSWAAISHELEYKSKYDIPDLLKRKLYRLAGLFELADEQFGEVKEEQFLLAQAIENKESIDNKEVYNEINYETIKNLFESENDVIKKYLSAGTAAGFIDNPDNDLSSEVDYSRIVELLSMLKIVSIEQLDKLLKLNLSKAEDYFAFQFKLHKSEKDASGIWIITASFLVYIYLMSFLSKKQLKSYAPPNWSSEILDSVKDGILKWKDSKNSIK